MLVNVGHGNMVMFSKAVVILSPESASLRRLKDDARERNALLDTSQGRRKRSSIISGRDHVILSAVQVDALTKRFFGGYGT